MLSILKKYNIAKQSIEVVFTYQPGTVIRKPTKFSYIFNLFNTITKNSEIWFYSELLQHHVIY